jgi:hypothetical protein
VPLPSALVDHYAVDLERKYTDGWGVKAEFYVRVGPNTVPARHHEIAAGFRQAPTATTF